MFVLELAFDDHPDRLAARPAHRERLQALHATGRLVMAGPFADDSGALHVYDVADADELTQVIDGDPYYRAPGVTIVGQREWTPIVR